MSLAGRTAAVGARSARVEPGAPTAHRRRRPIDVTSYLLVAPAVLMLGIFVIYPLVTTMAGSLYSFGVTSPVAQYVGLGNYRELLADPIFWTGLVNNGIILVGSIVLQVGLGTILAAVLDRGIRHGSVVFRTIIFAPIMISSVAVGLLWSLIYDPHAGLANALMRLIGLHGPQAGWLGDPDVAIYAVLVVGCWQHIGFMMVLMLAGMQTVPEELYQAARIDGADGVYAFRHITLPHIRNVLIVGCLITMIGAFRVFDLIYVLTRGGPGNSTQVLGTYIFQNAFTLSRMGYADALAMVLLVVAVGLGIVQMRVSRRGI